MTVIGAWLRARAQRLWSRPDGGGGAVSVLLVVLAAAVPICTGLIVDGAGKVRALSRADNLAEEAARAGTTGINIGALSNGTAEVLDANAAQSAARAYLTRTGVSSTVTIDNGNRLVVTVTITEPTVMLGVIGIDQFTVTGSGVADLVRT